MNSVGYFLTLSFGGKESILKSRYTFLYLFDLIQVSFLLLGKVLVIHSLQKKRFILTHTVPEISGYGWLAPWQKHHDGKICWKNATHLTRDRKQRTGKELERKRLGPN